MTELRDPYEVLGLRRGASPREIRAAYRTLARRHHPDLTANPESAARMSSSTLRGSGSGSSFAAPRR